MWTKSRVLLFHFSFYKFLSSLCLASYLLCFVSFIRTCNLLLQFLVFSRLVLIYVATSSCNLLLLLQQVSSLLTPNITRRLALHSRFKSPLIQNVILKLNFQRPIPYSRKIWNKWRGIGKAFLSSQILYIYYWYMYMCYVSITFTKHVKSNEHHDI